MLVYNKLGGLTAGIGPRSARWLVADGSPASSSLFQTQKPHAECSFKLLSDPLQTPVTNPYQVALIHSLTHVEENLLHASCCM